MFFLIGLFILLFVVILALTCQKEKWRYGNWDFDDFPLLCKRKVEETEKELQFANTPHFGGTPNNSQVWM